jgi:hypothetical protein
VTRFGRSLLLPVLVLLAAPAGAVLLDDEGANDDISTAAIQVTTTPGENVEGGALALVAGDIDYVGIESLLPGNIVEVSTMPMQGSAFDAPDTIIGVFDTGGTAVCLNDDAFNNDDFEGLGSLCRFVIDTAGDYYVGVTGFSPVPFDGNHSEAGDYVLTVMVVPEPGIMLQLVSGVAGLLGLNRIRVRKSRAMASSSQSTRAL